MKAEQLQRLARLLGGEFKEFEINGPTIYACEWGNHEERQDPEFVIYADSGDERPAECFDLLDRLEANGWTCTLDNHVKVYRTSARRQRDPGMTCAISEESHYANGKTRTSAIVNLFLEVNKDA